MRYKTYWIYKGVKMIGYSWSKEDFREELIFRYNQNKMLINRDFRFKPYTRMTEKDMNGCLGDGIQTTDYLLCNGFEDALPDLIQQDNIIYEYNQYKQSWSKKSCTIFSAMWALSDLFNIQWDVNKEIKEADWMSYDRGRLPDSWWWVQAAVKLWADWYNASEYAKKYWQVAYYRVDVTDEDLIKEILSKGYTLMTSFQWNYSYIKDYDSDGILNGTKFWAATFGHAINVRKINWKRCCKDSAKWTDHNIYELEHKLSEIWCFSSNAYIYTKVKDNQLERIKKLNEIRTRLLQWIPLNSELWHLTGVKLYQDKLHNMNDTYREWLDTIEKELKSYS